MECISSETARRTVRTVVTLYELHAQVIAQLAVGGVFGRTRKVVTPDPKRISITKTPQTQRFRPLHSAACGGECKDLKPSRVKSPSNVQANDSLYGMKVRNLCYMVTRREKMKHTLCDLQEKIFHLQIQLLEEDIAGDDGITVRVIRLLANGQQEA
ncbi:E3 ubiquitin-protein ligase [Takifugu flavidus]|uniref:E3 ubiquitin-protein ligase n=1 Tax=Takifugu flavidus TaxID=433684 RepID=A0A5C6P6Q0_9TELE|nr:E3 ubiquitin-protein ligase [Takifugu flavidus]